MLSDLHIPAHIDPNAPKFHNEADESDTQSVYDESEENNNFDDATSSNVDDNLSSIAIQSVVGAHKETKINKNTSMPPPLSANVGERCQIALQYIANGLDCLQYFSMTEEKLSKEREEIAKQAEKMRIIQEEQNPTMARPYQAIPLPYEKLSTEKNFITENTVEKEDDKSRKQNKKKSHAKKSAPKAEESKQPLLSRCPSSSIPSWNIHLKLLLLEKACSIYATLTEQSYEREKYGLALKYISLAIKCQHIVTKHMSSITSQKICLLGRAGDCYFQCAQRFDSIKTYVAQYEMSRDVDEAIKKQLKKDVETIDGVKLPKPMVNMEELILKSISCYEAALDCGSGTESRIELIGRLGSVRNELGVKYMHWAQESYQKYLETKDAEKETPKEEEIPKTDPMYLTLARKSYDCLIRGIASFDEINDNANLAILLCNMGRFMRFRAHLDESKEQFSYKKICYENGFTSYERALTILESKKQNPNLWDLVTWELSTGKFTLGKIMLDSFSEQMVSHLEEIRCFSISR